uniref:Zinc finger protein 706 n=1 Tax=Felis catus TaxID=9685 RepID=A0ABI7YXW9_FELCA
WPPPRLRRRRARAAAGSRRGLLCSPLSSFPSLAGGGGRSGAGRAPPCSPSGHLPRPSRAARSLRRKTVPARVSGSGGGADAAGRPGAGVGARRRGRRGSRGAAGLPVSQAAARPVPARAAGRRESSGACQALQVAGLQAAERSGNLTPWRQQLVGFSRPGLPVAEGAGFGAAKASGRRVSGRNLCGVADMARGQQKIQSQQKNAKKQAGQKKKQGHDQKAAAKAALIYTCTVCRTQMPDPKTFKQHFESKHPKTPLPPELADVQA